MDEMSWSQSIAFLCSLLTRTWRSPWSDCAVRRRGSFDVSRYVRSVAGLMLQALLLAILQVCAARRGLNAPSVAPPSGRTSWSAETISLSLSGLKAGICHGGLGCTLSHSVCKTSQLECFWHHAKCSIGPQVLPFIFSMLKLTTGGSA